jgi:hypothetical protein
MKGLIKLLMCMPPTTVSAGAIMTKFGFGPAFSVISTSYLLAMKSLGFLARSRKNPQCGQRLRHTVISDVTWYI